ncbi:MAG TPA: hypothetical protein VFI03_01025 [Solirubrobacterales bacterium]|nr:hypothetical protein [Solirubrobacterales bacterium]
MRLPISACVLLAAAMLVGGACGGSSDGAPASNAATISKTVFVRKAEAICAVSKRKILAGFQRVGSEHADHFQEAKIAMMAEVVTPALEAQNRKIRALGAPAGDAAQVNAILETTQAVIEEGPKKLARSYTFYREAGKLAREYGLPTCSFE